jgi:sec-independent protein translocase protein TatA
MGVLKPWHIIVLVVVLILLFGAKRLPDAARSLGRSLRIIKAETKGLADDDLNEKADAQTSRQPLTNSAYATTEPAARPGSPCCAGAARPSSSAPPTAR